MSQAAGDAAVLTYATGVRAGLTARGWKILFRVGAVHLAVLVALLAVSSADAFSLVSIVRDAPGDWFVMLLVAQAVGIYVMVAANALAVAGYRVASRGGSPRRWFLAYVPTELTLMGLVLGISIALAAASPHQLAPTISIGTTYVVALVLPPAFVVLNLPLFLLLIPKLRRGCFAG